MAVASFTVPSLLWGLRLAPKPAPKTAADGGPWAFAAVRDTEDVEELLRTLDPLIRGLTLAGYDVQGVAFAVVPGGASAGEDPIDWVFVEDLRTMHVLSQPGGWFDTVGLSAPAGAEALVALLMHSREMYAGRGPLYGVPLPVTGATFPFDEVPAPDPDSGDDPPPWRHAVSSIAEGGVVSTLQIALARQEPDAQVPPLEEILAGLAGSQGYLLETIELDFMQGADQFAQFTSQEEPHGLLGMFDPSTWSFARERWAPGGVDTIHAFGQDLWGAILDDARIGLHPFVHGELFTQLPLREAIRRARGQAVGGWAMVRAFGDAVVARVTATGGELEPAVEDFIADLAKSSWTDALMAAHSLEVVDVLGYAPLVAFDETPAKRDQYDVTGFYESFALHRVATALPPPEELQTVQLNQAGELLTGYWQTRALDTNGRLQHIIGHRVVATRVAGLSGQYRFERTLLDPVSAGAQPDTIRGNATGTLTFVDAKRDGLPTIQLEIAYDGGAKRADDGLLYFLVKPVPHLSLSALASLPKAMQPRVESDQRRPLHSAERSYWNVAIDRLIADTRTYLLLDQVSAKTTQAAQADQLFWQTAATSWKFSASGKVVEDNGQVTTLKDLAAESLALRKLAIGADTRTAFTWLNEMLLDRQRKAGSQPPNTKHIQNALVLEAIARAFGAGRLWKYKYHLLVDGLAGEVPIIGGAGAFTGKMTITKIDPTTGATIWTQPYWATFGQVSRGLSGGLTIEQESSGEIDWPVDWSQEQFEGDFAMDQVQGGAAVPIEPPSEPSPDGDQSGKNWSGRTYTFAGTMTFQGDRTFLPMIGDARGFGRMKGAYVGVEGGTSSGVLARSNDEVQTPISAEEFLARLGQVVEVPDQSASVALFGVNSSTIIAPDGWSFLARFCADERAAFETPSSFLRLVGHASTTADDPVDVPLSKARAESTYQALRALLGPAFAVHEANTFIGYRGEYDALKYLPDDTEDARWRRVDIWIDASLLVGM